ncbi:phosphopantetheine-binding protein [Streptomyces sp. CT34]|uniref:phosphopantetheine-binding protein n=1 Tax=Streptomyces sp. CT34 TaxID=1553907 RepID=UPI0007C77A1A|nr:phosphopantetheine-binding protein [Streptomyces sp. CT34]
MSTDETADLLRAVTETLVEIGFDEGELAEAGEDWKLRAELGLSSVETTELQLALKQRFAVTVDLWDQDDYTLGRLAELIAEQRSGS